MHKKSKEELKRKQKKRKIEKGLKKLKKAHV